MLSDIIVIIILSVNLFFYVIGIEDINIIYNLSASWTMIFICISLGLYLFSKLKYIYEIREKIFIVNIIYIVVFFFRFPYLIVLLGPVLVEYILIKKYNQLFLAIYVFISLAIQIKLNIDYTVISLGLIASIFVYINNINENRKRILEKSNYELREKIYNLEESRKLESKLNFQSIETTKIEERNNISQKLHDKIGHVIAGSLMQLEALKIIINLDNEKSISMLDSITSSLREGMDDIRYTLRKIKPEQSEIGINNLKLILDEFEKSYKIECRLSLEGDIQEINTVYWKVIIDSLKEILTNTIKYSNCDKLNVDINILNKIIRVYIKDNGVCRGEIKKGMGLLGIEERVINMGGNVSFNNEDGFSTLIILNR